MCDICVYTQGRGHYVHIHYKWTDAVVFGYGRRGHVCICIDVLQVDIFYAYVLVYAYLYIT